LQKEIAKEWRGKYEPYKKDVDEYLNILKFLRYDHDLMLDGYRFNFAIDSHDAIRHVFPLARKSPYRSIIEFSVKNYRYFVREQIALSFIFHGLTKSVVLFAPYSVELNLFMEIQRRISISIKSLGLEKYNKTVEKNLQEGLLKFGIKTYPNIESLVCSLDKQTLFDLAEDYYKEFLALIQVNLVELMWPGVNLLLKLINIGRLAGPEHVIKGFSINEGELIKNYDLRKDTIKEFQSKEQKADAAMNDAFALEYISQLNKYENSEGRKGVVLFIASSTPMLKALEKEGRFGIDNLPNDYNFSRCPEFWLAYLMLRRKIYFDREELGSEKELVIVQEMRKEIDETEKLMRIFLKTAETFEELEKSDSLSNVEMEHLEKAGQILEKVRSKLNSWENLMLMRNEGLINDLLTKTTEQNRKVLRELAFCLKSLQDNSLGNKIKERISGIIKNVENVTIETRRFVTYQLIREPVIRDLLLREGDEGEIHVRSRKRERYIKDREYEIDFKNTKIISILQTLRVAWKKNLGIISAHDLKDQLQSAVFKPDERVELCLFWASFYLLKGEYKRGEYELQHGDLSEEEKTVDYFLMETVIERLLNNREKAEIVCIKGLRMAPRDSRLHREMGGILKEKWRSSDINLRSEVFKKSEEHFRIAIKEGKSKNFRLEAMASLANFLIESGTHSAITAARKILEDYEKLAEGEKRKHAKYWWAISAIGVIDIEKGEQDKETVKSGIERVMKSIEEGLETDKSLNWDELKKKANLFGQSLEGIKEEG